MLSNGEHELIYNNETVKRKRYEFRFLDKVYKCVEGFLIERCDDDGCTIENTYEEIKSGDVYKRQYLMVEREMRELQQI